MVPKPTMLCLAIVFFVTGVTQAKQRVYPTGLKFTTHFSCESVPKDNLLCSGDIKVRQGSGARVKVAMNLIYAKLEGLKNSASESCIKAVKKSSCLGFRRCERERLYVDIPNAISACEAARSICPEQVKDSMLDCNEKKGQYENKSFNASKCWNIKDPTGTCPDIKYKILDAPSRNLTAAFVTQQQILQNLKRNVTSKCYENFRSTSCQAIGVICSPDETYAISYVSKQKCEKVFQCIPETLYSSKKRCSKYPDESKGIDLPDPNGASFLSHTGSHIFTAMFLLNFLSFL